MKFFAEKIREADLIICHSGDGEHMDDRQVELIQALKQEGVSSLTMSLTGGFAIGN
jgi:UDP-N-acetylglucosamine transferase subunit ALG13